MKDQPMSITITWKPTNPKCEHLKSWVPQEFIQAMSEAFDEPPWKLNKTDLERLEGLSAFHESYTLSNRPNPFKQLILILDSEIEIEVSY